MAKSIIDKVKLSQMLRSGKTAKVCAEYFGVSGSAISQARKELKVAVVKSVALENAQRVVEKNLNAVEQLLDINRKANTLLDAAIEAADHDTTLRAMREIRGQLELQLEIFKTLYDVQAVADFQKEVLTVIGEVDNETRERIVRRLKEARAIRGSITIS